MIQVTPNAAQGIVQAVAEIEAPPERVFDAITDPKELEAWWGADDLYRTSDWQIDLRVGGAWSCMAKNVHDGRVTTVRGEYLAVERPRLLECTWLASWEGFARTVIRYDLEPIAIGTRLSVLHRGFPTPEACNGHAAGWTNVLGWLAGHVGAHVRAHIGATR